MTPFQRAVLFWVVLVSYIGVVVASLGTATGAWPWDAPPLFERVAIGTVIVGIVGLVVASYRGAFTSPADIFIVLEFPYEVDLRPMGRFIVWDERSGRSGRSGNILALTGQAGWFCRLPHGVRLSDSIELRFWETTGAEWEVKNFSPSFNRQPAVQRRIGHAEMEGKQ